MKTARLVLLLMLAVLLPLRGAVAAALLCPMGPALAASMAAPAEAPAGAHCAPAANTAAADDDADAGTPAAAAGGCSMCAAFCAATPLPSSPPPLAVPPRAAVATFPELGAPQPSFLFSGPERPPRSA